MLDFLTAIDTFCLGSAIDDFAVGHRHFINY